MTIQPRPGSPAWREQQTAQVLAFAAGSRVEGGFGWLEDTGRPEPGRPLDLWINARMTYVFSRAYAVGGDPEHRALARHGVRALTETFSDQEFGGWYAAVHPDGDPTDDTKAAYGHAFVVLAACTATDAGIDGAAALAEQSLALQVERFWDDAQGWVIETWDRDWTTAEPYRGANAAMHTVESWLAAATTTGDPAWLARAARMGRRVVDVADGHDGRIVEHFTTDLIPDPGFNRDRPADPFRPYGATPGHAFEWARLLLELDAATGGAQPWAGPAAERLFRRAVDDAVGATPGLPYTTDWAGAPVVAERFHWVICEALMAAEALRDAGAAVPSSTP